MGRTKNKSATDVATRLAIKVVPGAAQSGIAGWLGGALKIRVSAPPEKGKANSAAAAVVAEALGLPAASVRVVRGMTSRQKVLEIEGLNHGEVTDRLARNTAR